MVNKTERLRISVNNEGGKEKKPKKVKTKRPAVKKKIIKKPVKQEKIIRSAPKKKKSGFWGTLAAVVITALLVGGGIYAWQQKTGEEKIKAVHGETRSLRLDFEKQVQKLKNKLTGVESENQELKTTKKELEEKASLLEGALKKYINDDLGLSFEYPAILGDVELEFKSASSGTYFLGKFSKSAKLTFGGISPDFLPSATSAKAKVLETLGYYKRSGHYYFQGVGDNKSRDKEFTPAKVIETGKEDKVVIDKNSFAVHAIDGVSTVDIGENIGAIINLDNKEYPGLAFLNKDLGVVNMNDFEDIISSITVLKK